MAAVSSIGERSRAPLPSQESARNANHRAQSSNKSKKPVNGVNRRRNPPSTIPSSLKQGTFDLSYSKIDKYLTSLPEELVRPSNSGKEGEEEEEEEGNRGTRKLDLSNQKDLGPALHGIRFLGESLTWLNITGVECSNQKQVQWGFLRMCRTLFVLNMSHCNLSELPKDLTSLKSLKAFVASHNDLTSSSLIHLDGLTNLNSLILSNNHLTSLPSSLFSSTNAGSLVQLKKFSLANNKLSSDGLPDLGGLESLEELRLNGNSNVNKVPVGLAKCEKLTLLELSNTGIDSWKEVEALSECKSSVNLGMRGTPLAEKEGDAFKDKIIVLLPNLRILDNSRFDPKYLQRKEKEKARKETDAGPGPSNSKTVVNTSEKKMKEKRQPETATSSVSAKQKGKRKADSQEQDALDVATSRKKGKKVLEKVQSSSAQGEEEEEEEPMVYEDAAAETSMNSLPPEPKKKRSRYRKRLERELAAASGLPYDSYNNVKQAKQAKSVGGSMSAPVDTNLPDQEKKEKTKGMEESQKERSSVLGVVDVQREKEKQLNKVSKLKNGGKQHRTEEPTKEEVKEKEDVLSLLLAKPDEGSKVASGWD